MRLPFTRRSACRFALVSALFLLPALSSRAQRSARDAASRGAAISVFAGPLYLHPAYSVGHGIGLSGGADFTKFFRTPVLPSLEVRGAYSPTGTTDGETTALIGVRFDLPFLPLGRLHPYGDFLVGTGTIHFAHPSTGYLSDNSTVYHYGGGLTVDLRRNFSAQAEFQQQHWNLGNKNNFTSFAPYAIGLGVRYQIPFGFERAH